MSNDPLTIHIDRFAELLRGLGLDPVNMSDVKSVHMERDRIEVVRYRRGESGQLVIVDCDIATETTVVGIRNGPPEPVGVNVSALDSAVPQYLVSER